jgi:hypothetical protein
MPLGRSIFNVLTLLIILCSVTSLADTSVIEQKANDWVVRFQHSWGTLLKQSGGNPQVAAQSLAGIVQNKFIATMRVDSQREIIGAVFCDSFGRFMKTAEGTQFFDELPPKAINSLLADSTKLALEVNNIASRQKALLTLFTGFSTAWVRTPGPIDFRQGLRLFAIDGLLSPLNSNHPEQTRIILDTLLNQYRAFHPEAGAKTPGEMLQILLDNVHNHFLSEVRAKRGSPIVQGELEAWDRLAQRYGLSHRYADALKGRRLLSESESSCILRNFRNFIK